MSAKRCADDQNDECEHKDKQAKTEDVEKVSDEKIATPVENASSTVEDEKTSVKSHRQKRCKHSSCEKRACFGIKGTRTALFCRPHADTAHVNVVSARCIVNGCNKHPGFNVKGSKKAFCRDHRSPEMVYVNYRRCISDRCDKQPRYNLKGSKKPLFCSEHADTSMIDLYAPRCAAKDCEKYSSFNFDGSKHGLYCREHAERTMVDVISLRCIETGCKKRPSFNVKGSMKPRYCSDHANSSMLNVKRDRCKAAGCDRIPCFNNQGSKKGLYCRGHAESSMICVTARVCAAINCNKRPSFNFEGSEGGIYCREHAESGMVNVTNLRCAADDCKKCPVFNFRGSKSGLYCRDHAEPEMIDVINPRCTSSGCTSLSSYGLPGLKPSHCAPHKQLGQVFNPRRSCEYDKCRRPATFGIRKPERCDEHKTTVDRDFVLKRCVVCDQPALTFPDDNCCDLCTKRTHNVRLKRQLEIRAMLNDCKDDVLSKYQSYDKAVTNCSRYRPDFMWDSKTHVVILEVDEHQHKDYPEECELARMQNLTQELHMPCVFVRYNPDSYKGQPASLRDRNRHEHLCKVLKHCISLPAIENPAEMLRVTKLFFDGYKYPEACVLTNLPVE